MRVGRPRSAVIGVAIAFGAPPPAALANPPTPASEVVVTASRLSGAAGRATVQATVLAPDATPAGATLGEVLATVSDFAVQRPGGAAGVGSIYLRGSKPNFTPIMVEGIPLNDQTNTRGGSTDVSALTVLDVDRLEVVRGALSSLYGSGAVEGVINLILPGGASRPMETVLVSGGSDRDAAGAVQWRGPVASDAGASLNGQWADEGHAVEGSSRRNASVSAKVAPLDGSQDYGLILRLSDSVAQAFPDESGGPRLAVLRERETTRQDQALVGGHARVRVGPAVTVEVNAAGAFSRFDDQTPGVAPAPSEPTGTPAGVSHDTYDLARGQFIVRWNEGSAWRALAGMEIQQEDGQEHSTLTFFGLRIPGRYDLHRTTPAAFAETSADVGPWSIDASVRVDQPTGLGDHGTGRVGLAYRLSGSASLHASWGESFKAPSFYALGNPFVGNRGLQPETAETSAAGLSWRPAAGVRADVDLFRTRYHQLVDFSPGPPPELVNRSNVLSQGVQVTVAASVTSRGDLSLSATYVDTKDQTTGDRLMELPPWRATAALDWRFSSIVRGRLDVLYVGERLDNAIPVGERALASYTTLNARIFVDLGRMTTVEATVENALNAAYEDAIGFPAPGVVGKVAVRRRF